MITTQCLNCGKQAKGRADKKFSSDNCRNEFNNKQNKDEVNYIRNVNNALRKNRRVLKELLNDQATYPKSTLEGLGFDFDLFTSTYNTPKGKTYFYCYELGYLSLDNQILRIVSKNH